MNIIFADLIAEGKVAVYLDDILIWSSDLKEHRKVVHEVLRRLEEYDLYLWPKECEFEKTKIEYLSWFTPFFALKRPPRGPGRSCHFPAPFDALSRLSRAL